MRGGNGSEAARCEAGRATKRWPDVVSRAEPCAMHEAYERQRPSSSIDVAAVHGPLCTGQATTESRRTGVAGELKRRPDRGISERLSSCSVQGGVDCCRATIVATESETIEVHGSAYLVRKSSQVAGYRKMFGGSPHFRARSRCLPQISPSTRRALTRPRGMDCATAGTRSGSHAPETRRPATEARGHSPRKAGVTAHPRSVDFWHAAPH